MMSKIFIRSRKRTNRKHFIYFVGMIHPLRNTLILVITLATFSSFCLITLQDAIGKDLNITPKYILNTVPEVIANVSINNSSTFTTLLPLQDIQELEARARFDESGKYKIISHVVFATDWQKLSKVTGNYTHCKLVE
jgi:hypothetical protein